MFSSGAILQKERDKKVKHCALLWLISNCQSTPLATRRPVWGLPGRGLSVARQVTIYTALFALE